MGPLTPQHWPGPQLAPFRLGTDWYIYVCDLDWTWIRNLMLSLLKRCHLAAIPDSGRLQWNASHAQPYSRAKLSAACIHPEMAKRKCRVPSSIWAQDGNFCQHKQPKYDIAWRHDHTHRRRPTALGEDWTAEVAARLEVDIQWSSGSAVHVVPELHTLINRCLKWSWDQACLVSQDTRSWRLNVHIVTCHTSMYSLHTAALMAQPPNIPRNSFFTHLQDPSPL